MAQDELLASYAEDCVSDVSSCLTSNNYESDRPESTKSRTAINSCYSQIKTCMSVNGNVFGSVSPEALRTWVTGTYSTIETYTANADMDLACNMITDEEECRALQGYCLNNNGSSTAMGRICIWTPGTGTSSGTCTRSANCN